MKSGTIRKEVIIKVVDINNLPNCKGGRHPGYAVNIINDFMASDAKAIEVSRENTKANGVANALRIAARRMGVNEDFVIFQRDGVVYLVKRKVCK